MLFLIFQFFLGAPPKLISHLQLDLHFVFLYVQVFALLFLFIRHDNHTELIFKGRWVTLLISRLPRLSLSDFCWFLAA